MPQSWICLKCKTYNHPQQQVCWQCGDLPPQDLSVKDVYQSNQRLVIGLITFILWSIAAVGWLLAYTYATTTRSYPGAEVYKLSFFSTLGVLPVPYIIFRLITYFHARWIPTFDKKLLLDILIYIVMAITLVSQAIIFGSAIFIAAVAGGLDILEDPIPGVWPVFCFIPVAALITWMTWVIFATFRRRKRVYWTLLPAGVINGILFFVMLFVQHWLKGR